MESGSGFIEVRVISCKSLRAFNFFQKLSVYALVSIANDDDDNVDRKQPQRTPTDREGDGNPEWNHTIRFNLFCDCDKYFLHFDLYHEGAMFGDKFIGEVVVPLVDLVQKSNNGCVRFVTYQVRTRDGKSNGTLDFSFKVKIGEAQGLMKMESPASLLTGYPETESGSPRVRYPVLDLEGMLVQDLNPPQNGYYPPPPPYLHPPAAVAHGGRYCYHPPPPPGSYMWGPSLYGSYAAHDGTQLACPDEPFETWANGYGVGGVGGNYHSPSRNNW
ncbi:hypothetical protein F3Y22_tig00110584pilonHSYRG00620 [Hibiscus syriacus]|uniref:C2 domain-containing protein n=1 Tax=Hibiscus syriacus TaxID=106335 RepID=A0A6A3A4P5_HIBSY|nr:protein SRC2 homolog [Hibiscus syriacus]KAE8699290.1 hypothetical protein F3Y22_tig00110584pilonHSYRG00620 [Hibiscus syriacus]